MKQGCVREDKDQIAGENFRGDEAHRYITDPVFSYWIALMARTGRHWNIMLDLITQSLADLDSPDQPWSKAIITNLKQAFFFPGQKDVEVSLRKLQLTEYHIEQYKKLDASRYEVLYWSDGGLRRILRSVADPHTYWLATTDARERTMRNLMKQRYAGSVRRSIEELVKRYLVLLEFLPIGLELRDILRRLAHHLIPLHLGEEIRKDEGMGPADRT